MELTPITRKEFYLAGITGMDVQPPSPVTRLESYLDDILNGTVSQLMPLNRVESYLAKISGADVNIPVPVTRLEVYLAAIAGMEIEVPDPVTREEHWLWQWANAGPGGVIETVTGTLPLTLANAIYHAIVSLTRYGLCTQDGTPTPAAPVDIMCNNGALTASKNIFDGGYTLGGTITNGGADGSTNAARLRLDYTLLPPGTYTLSTNGICNNTVVWAYSSATGSGATKLSTDSAFSLLPFTFTLSEAKYVRAMCRNSNNPTLTAENAGAFQIEAGESATEYMAPGLVYASGTPEVLTVSADGAEMQTASVPMLLSVGGYKDEAELISGIKTGKVGVSVYCGSADENWSRLGTNAFAVTNSKKIVGKYAMLCSHYTYTAATSARCSSGEFGCSSGTLRSVYFKNELYDTVDDWRAAIAADPIIVVYPLATETTEQGTAQHLVTHKGTNIVDSTANVGPVEAKVEYMATAS